MDGSTRSDGEGDRSTAGVVYRLGAVDPTAPGVATTESLEVDERIAGRGQATATGRTSHRRLAAVADGGRANLGIGRVEHGGTFRTGIGLDGGKRAHPGVTRPH